LACLLVPVNSTDLDSLWLGFKSFGLSIVHTVRTLRAQNGCPAFYIPPGSVVGITMPTQAACPTSHAPVNGLPYVVNTDWPDALDFLAWESAQWARLQNIVLYIFDRIAAYIVKDYNSYNGKPKDAATCAASSAFTNSIVGQIQGLLSNNSQNISDAETFLNQTIAFQVNPRYPGYEPVDDFSQVTNGFPATASSQLLCNIKRLQESHIPDIYANETCWELNVHLDPNPLDLNPIDFRTSPIIGRIQEFLTVQGQQGLVALAEALAKPGVQQHSALYVTKNGDPYVLLPSRGLCNSTLASNLPVCIDIHFANLSDCALGTDLLSALNNTQIGNTLNEGTPFNISDFIPGFGAALDSFSVYDVQSFKTNAVGNNADLQFAKPYVPWGTTDTDARFTLAHRIGFGSLHVTVGFNLAAASYIVYGNTSSNPYPNADLVDNLFFDFEIKNLDLQVITMTALNHTRLCQIPIEYLIPWGLFIQGMTVDDWTCPYGAFYLNGLYIPQLQLYADDIVGPKLTITGVSPPGIAHLFSPAMASFIAATVELLAQLVKGYMPNITQGTVRPWLNNHLATWVNTAYGYIISGVACPPIKFSQITWQTKNPQGTCAATQFPALIGGNDPNASPLMNFSSPLITEIFLMVNSLVGGDPVKVGTFTVDNVLDVVLDAVLVNNTDMPVTHPG